MQKSALQVSTSISVRLNQFPGSSSITLRGGRGTQRETGCEKKNEALRPSTWHLSLSLSSSSMPRTYTPKNALDLLRDPFSALFRVCDMDPGFPTTGLVSPGADCRLLSLPFIIGQVAFRPELYCNGEERERDRRRKRSQQRGTKAKG